MKLFILLLAFGFALASTEDEIELTTVSPSSPLPDQEDPDNIITNGYAAPDGHVPYIVSLSLRRDGSNAVTLCGGSIIGNTWVLTAAHCLNGQHYVDIHFGSNWRWNGQFSYRVRSNDFIQHHLWPNTNGNDIGLIRTPHIHFNNRVNIVRLPTFNQMNEQFNHWWTTACGWGGQANGQLADWLQCVDNQVMSNSECTQYYGYLPIGILCIRTPGGRSTCGGDSGGPLVTHNGQMQIGVTSFVSGAGCTASHPAGFTRITAHLAWIRQHSGIAYY